MTRATKSPMVSMVLALACCLAAGCACVQHARTAEPAPAAGSIEAPATAAPIVRTVEATPAEVEASTAHETPASTPVSRSARPAETAPTPVTPAARPAEVTPAPRTAVARAPAKAPSVTATPAPAPKPVAAAAVTPAPAPKVVSKVATVPPAPPPAATLDLKSLEARLRQTKAIGVMTKLSLKNQIDDLLDGFRAYHKRQGSAKLADLRRNYDLLVLKVLSLLQDSDPSLAREIVKSRTAIWNILEDSRKFTESNLMAGATP